jgi:hypothetical protein
MTSTRTPTLVKLKRAHGDIPLALQTIYNLKAAKRIDWLTRVGPGGWVTRDSWILIEGCRAWAAREGLALGPSLREAGR